MTWWQYFKAHRQRPESWLDLGKPAYWRRLQQERTAHVRTHEHSAPCGRAITTQFIAADGSVLRQDVAIHVTKSALSNLVGGL